MGVVLFVLTVGVGILARGIVAAVRPRVGGDGVSTVAPVDARRVATHADAALARRREVKNVHRDAC